MSKITVYMLNPGGDVDSELRRVDYYMSGEDFEVWCADILRVIGYDDVKLTDRTGDHGVDITAYRDGVKYGFQCKCYSKNVGNKAVQEIISGIRMYQCQKAVVITNQFFTKNAKLEARNDVQLWDRDALRHYLNVIYSAQEDYGEDDEQEESDEPELETQEQTDDNIKLHPSDQTLEWSKSIHLWPYDIGASEIDYDYYSHLPRVSNDPRFPLYINCIAVGGDKKYWNPFPLVDSDPEIYGVIELFPEREFETTSAAEHFLRAVQREYFAVCNEHNATNVSIFARAGMVRKTFVPGRNIFVLKNWSTNDMHIPKGMPIDDPNGIYFDNLHKTRGVTLPGIGATERRANPAGTPQNYDPDVIMSQGKPMGIGMKVLFWCGFVSYALFAVGLFCAGTMLSALCFGMGSVLFLPVGRIWNAIERRGINEELRGLLEILLMFIGAICMAIG